MVDAEAAVLSSCLLSSEALDAAQEILLVEHFGTILGIDWSSKRSSDSCREIARSTRCPSPASCETKRRLEHAGGAAYLAELVDAPRRPWPT